MKQQIVRPTSVAAALFQAAMRVPAEHRPGTIANQIEWRADNTQSGVVREPSVTLNTSMKGRQQ